MISTGDLRKGLAIELDGVLYNIVDWEHIKMGRGSAQVRLKLKDLRKGHTVEKTFQAGEKFSRARVDRHSMQFLYSDDDFFHFMNNETFEQMALSPDQVGDAAQYLVENGNADVLTYGDELVFGITTDYDAAPELSLLAAGIQREMARLVALSDDSVLLFTKDRRKRAARGIARAHPSAPAKAH